MTPKQFVAIQMARRFTARKIPDLKHIQYWRTHAFWSLRLGFEPTHAAALFNPEWLYEGYERFRDRPEHYYANEVIPWKTITEYM